MAKVLEALLTAMGRSRVSSGWIRQIVLRIKSVISVIAMIETWTDFEKIWAA